MRFVGRGNRETPDPDERVRRGQGARQISLQEDVGAARWLLLEGSRAGCESPFVTPLLDSRVRVEADSEEAAGGERKWLY